MIKKDLNKDLNKDLTIPHCKRCFSKRFIGDLCKRHFYGLNRVKYYDIYLKSEDREFCLTALQQHWLNTQGGRDVSDVIINGKEMCVIFTYQREEQIKKIPSNEEIKAQYRDLFSGVYLINNNVDLS